MGMDNEGAAKDIAAIDRFSAWMRETKGKLGVALLQLSRQASGLKEV